MSRFPDGVDDLPYEDPAHHNLLVDSIKAIQEYLLTEPWKEGVVPPPDGGGEVVPPPTELHEDLAHPPPAGDLAALRNAVSGTASGQTCPVSDGIYRIPSNAPIRIPGGVRLHNANKRAWFFLSRDWAGGGEAGNMWTRSYGYYVYGYSTSTRSVPNIGTNEPGGVTYWDQAKALRYEMCVGIKPSGEVTRFESVPAGGNPNEGEFCFVSSNDRRIRLGGNPADYARIEVVETQAGTARWFWPDGDGVTLEGLVFRYCPSGPSNDPAGSHDRHNFTMRNCIVGDVHGSAVNCGGSTNVVIEDCLIEYFGNTGILTYNVNGLHTNRNQIYHGGYGGWENLWQGGATKFCVSRNHECNDNIIASGEGSGLWWDESNTGPINVRRNFVHHWTGPGFHYEISTGPVTVTDNCFAYCTFAGGWPNVYISSSSGAGEISGNLIVTGPSEHVPAAGRGLQAYWAQDRTNDKVVNNWNWHHNRFIHETTGEAVFVGGGAEQPAQNNRGSGNAYYFSGSPLWAAGGSYTSIGAWNGTAFEEGGTLVDKATADEWREAWGI